MNEKALAIQQKAFSLRDYLNEGKVKESLASSMPQWLSIDRLLRVFMGAVNKNPALLDCTRESIVISCMQCAQLGLEPILGRAWLVPYNNKKNINGKWVTVAECQMQPGYQGLIDLARRSNTISDVYGLNVYDNDDFDLSFGTDRKIHHKPWYMSKGIDGPGQVIGAYVVWLLKDGTKHPEFMHISDIHKRRDVSKAYQSAMKHKKTDTPWLQWPEDMNLKTVIKHSSKMVPASIEFLEAVEVDNASEMGKGPYLPEASDMFLPKIDEPEDPLEGKPEVASDPFQAIEDELISIGATAEQVDAFIGGVAKDNNMSFAEVKASAVDDKNNFINGVLNSVQGDKETPGYHGLSVPSEKEQILAAQAKLEENRKQERERKDSGDSLEKLSTAEMSISQLGKGRPCSSVKNAKDWLKNYLSVEDELPMFEDRAYINKVKNRKVTVEKFLKDHKPPAESPPSPGAQEQMARREAFLDFCLDADKKVEARGLEDGAPGLLDEVLNLLNYVDLSSVPEINFPEFKDYIKSEARRRGVVLADD